MNSAHKWLSRVFSLETEKRLKHEGMNIRPIRYVMI